ncbi:acetylornithine aminotransferase apoenzyme [Jatrophihabitans endophyticus]|uniref:Acetylornithine aminotransferase n=1 Tax=Jatrophihabitans endophyticus TaxID=1206085 RepID=A0A1M5MMP8_9ACTN|nr:acetylornithine transaminase [Jatrophihabitans endophyticus]SHG78515.1 acetylornithine aminotransferase apoenzyme [Jatrophihabitans endophyticus]
MSTTEPTSPGEHTAAAAARWQAVMMDNYGTPPIALDRGEGVRVWDVDGNRYLDLVGGIAVSSLGHAHPAVVAAVTEQVGRLVHTSNLAMHEPGIRLAERLVGLLGLPARVFFANSGAEANECALKLARRHRPGGAIVSCHASFHGRTMGALSVTGNAAKRDPFAPLPGPVTFVDYGDVAALRAAVGPDTAAVIVEPTLGEGGVVPPPAGFLAAARESCDASGALLIVDEVQSGIGRTGHWFASQAEGVRPDVVTLAKGLGGGMPIGACLAVGTAGELFGPGDHGSTFGGNPVSCAAALAVLTTIADEHLLDDVKRVGEHLADRLAGLDSPLVDHVRGTGLWRAVALTGAHAAAVEVAARERGLLVNAVRPDALRLAPPLVLTEADVDEAVPTLSAALADVAGRVSTGA